MLRDECNLLNFDPMITMWWQTLVSDGYQGIYAGNGPEYLG